MEIYKAYLSEIAIAITGIAAWLFERKKRREDLKSAQTENIQKIVDLYQEALSDLKGRYDTEIKELELKYDLKFKILAEDLKQVRTNLNLYKTKYTNLKRDFEAYKKKEHNVGNG